ncbi:MAG: hypothetical protein U9R34_00070 [Nanoarchaeota archaeon]|nr:hypothetical protein [Nanoarchaeota archaeon]
MVKSLEKTLEFEINVSDLEVYDFSEKVMDDFEANPYGIRHLGGYPTFMFGRSSFVHLDKNNEYLNKI